MPFDWPALISKPSNFADGAVSEAWFGTLAETLLNRTEFRIAGQPHRLIEVEVYYHSPAHPDPFVHQHDLQLKGGRWYFHRRWDWYRSGNYKGLDLAFGDGVAYGGILFRGLEKPDGTILDGPSVLVEYLLKQTRHVTVAQLDKTVGTNVAWEADQPFGLVAISPVKRPVVRTARFGLSLLARQPQPNDPAARYLLRRYRYLTEPDRTRKGRPHTALAPLLDGKLVDAVAARIGCRVGIIQRYAAGLAAGRGETDVAPYYGRAWKTADLCRLHGLLARTKQRG